MFSAARNVEALERVKRLSNRFLDFIECDVRDSAALDQTLERFRPDAVIHFAGLKAVGESVAEPARYYDVNVGGTAVLLGAMERAGCHNIVFSSSATVYGAPNICPVMKTTLLPQSTHSGGMITVLNRVVS